MHKLAQNPVKTTQNTQNPVKITQTYAKLQNVSKQTIQNVSKHLLDNYAIDYVIMLNNYAIIHYLLWTPARRS